MARATLRSYILAVQHRTRCRSTIQSTIESSSARAGKRREQ